MDEAREHAAVAKTQARAWGAPRVVARALRVRAAVEPPTTACVSLCEAVALLTGSAARLDEASARLELGRVLAGWPARRSRWRAPHGTGPRASDGGRRVEEAARRELVACGYRPRRAAASGVDALTGSERRVVRWLRAGLPIARLRRRCLSPSEPWSCT